MYPIFCVLCYGFFGLLEKLNSYFIIFFCSNIALVCFVSIYFKVFDLLTPTEQPMDANFYICFLWERQFINEVSTDLHLNKIFLQTILLKQIELQGKYYCIPM